MLKAIQIVGSSSGFVSYRFRKPQPNSAFSLISRKSIITTSETLLLPASQLHSHKSCSRDFRMSSTHSKSSSSSSLAIQSTGYQSLDFLFPPGLCWFKGIASSIVVKLELFSSLLSIADSCMPLSSQG
ncbi:hypothetical protein MTR67_012849 [Solanum verrucosum]|uniref:Uncharacterized protein n=1 Tax=Solanum verrucosum TaxID=315347 RepID=A0AAF0THV3_SOLVR|nr:hypothetical protein MTR67_012849 [Solanum verrucosum]